MEKVLGQDRAVATLAAALRSGRFHHAWIFGGPRGVGKFTTAVEVARILLDPGAAGTLRPDPGAKTSRLIDAGAHPDLHVVRKELAAYSDNPELRRKKLMNIPIDLLRELVLGGQTADGKYREAPAYRTPAMQHAKVFIIDEAELIEREGQNAMLKTLEEPPPRTYLFLITSRPQRLYPTVRSRCQYVPFGPLGEQAMDAWLAQSGLDLGGDERRWIKGFAAGAPGMALLAAAYGFHAWQRALDPMLAELDRGAFPVDMGAVMAKLIEGFAVAWVKAHENASKDAANKDGARHMLSILAAHARRRLAAASAGNGDAGPWPAVIDLIAAAELQIARNVNLKIALENLAVQWARAASPAAVSPAP